MNDTNTRRSGLFAFLVFLAACALYSAFLYYFRQFYHDDAYISLRYIRNWANGLGLSFNPGERVEGYTNFLFMAATFMLMKLDFDPVPATRVIGIGSGYLVFLLLFLSAGRKEGRSAGPALLTLLPLSGCGCFAAWSLSGLETVFFALLLSASLFLSLKKNFTATDCYFAGLVFGLSAMARPEALLFAAVTAIYFGFSPDRSLCCGGSKAIFMFIFGLALILIPYLVWKHLYFGSIIPNTFYAKGELSVEKIRTGLVYLGRFMGLFGLSAVFAFFGFRRSRNRPRTLYLAGMTAAYFGYIVLMGGDHMPAFRFFVPALPLFYLLIAEGLSSLHNPAGTVKTGLSAPTLWAVVLCITAANAFASAKFLPRAKVRDPAAFVGENVGLWMRDHWPRDARVALNTAGSTPYFADLYCIDMLGITDPQIAKRRHVPKLLPWQSVPGHEKGDGAYVLMRKPDFIILGPAEGDTSAWFLSDLEILRSPEFKSSYQYRFYRIPVNDPEAKNYPSSARGEIFFQYYERTGVAVPDSAGAPPG